MLRKNQAIKLPPDDVESMRAEIERAFTPKPENRDPTALPPELERAFSPQSEPSRTSRASFRPRVNGFWAPSRIALLGVAIVAGGIAAFLTLQQSPPAPATVTETVTEVVPEARLQVLVAKAGISVGQRLTPETVEWSAWPEGSVRPEYITHEVMPDAPAFMSGSIARFEIFAGEPIREQKLVKADGGYLSALLESGQRGVSVIVTADSASGGFIVPNDHVDVVLTRQSALSGQESKTLLHNVRVLAINTDLGGSTTPPEDGATEEVTGFEASAIATLALDPTQAETIISASTIGKLSLVLRSLADVGQPLELTSANQAIRMSSPFWRN